MRVIEGSAFIAAPLGGMTLAQLGADVIRFDNIGGGIDAKRSPLTKSGTSIYWAGWNKGKRSIMIDLRSDEGRELVSRLITAPGKDGGLFLTNLPMHGWSDYETLRQRRDDLIAFSLIGSSDEPTPGGVRHDRPGARDRPPQPRLRVGGDPPASRRRAVLAPHALHEEQKQRGDTDRRNHDQPSHWSKS